MPALKSEQKIRAHGTSADGAGSPAVETVHAVVAGRVRFKVRGLYRCEALQQFLAAELSSEGQIISFSSNVFTGNLLILFQPQGSHREVARLVEAIVNRYQKRVARRLTGAPSRAVSDAYPAAPFFASGRKEGASARKVRKLVLKGEPQPDHPWHLLPGEKACTLLDTSVSSGLTGASVRQRLHRFGPNLLPEGVPRSRMAILLSQLKSLPVLLLTGSALLSLGSGGLAEAAIIMIVIGINATVGYLTESRAEAAVDSLKRLVRPVALVLREGRLGKVKGEELVPGDLLVLRHGDYIAADCRIIAAQQLTVDESSLTGESLPVAKRPDTLEGRELPLGDRVNMGYLGTLVTGGSGLAVVVCTGRFSEMGRVQALIDTARTPKTPMEKQLERLGNQLALFGAGVCGALFAVGVLRGYGVQQMLKNAISLAVAAIPEGLPAIATTALALGIQEMKRHKVLMRRLDAVEALGCVQTICLDKTGTLTFNRMSAVALHAGLQEIQLPEGDPGSLPTLLQANREGDALVKACALCNETELKQRQEGLLLRGSSTEKALVELALRRGLDVNRLRQRYPTLRITYRSESRNYMISSHRIGGDGESSLLPEEAAAAPGTRLVILKGSPQEVLAKCDRLLQGGVTRPLSDGERVAIELANERMAGRGLRVLGGACFLAGEADGEDPEVGLVWLGLIGMADPVKPGTRDLMALFHRAGIETLMITGDQVPTAFAIAKELQLSQSSTVEILDSANLRELDPGLLQAVAGRVQVFARVSPAQKLQIVQALQRGGRVVAMTGDGINDSPALKAADIGVAMGKAGTDVAREVADVVLEDDQLETLMLAIRQGRATYGNIRKSVRFLLATNLSETMLVSAGVVTGLGQPLNPMQLLWINLLTDIFPGLALSLEPPEPDLLLRSPRDPQQGIVTTKDLAQITREAGVITSASLGAYLYGLLVRGRGVAGTLAFMSLTSAQLLHSLCCRSAAATVFERESLPENPYLRWALGGSFALQALALVLPGLRRVLGVAPLNLADFLVIGGSAAVPLIINEAAKNGDTP